MPDDDALEDDGMSTATREPPIELGRDRLLALLDAHCQPARGTGEARRWTCMLPQHEGDDPSVCVEVVDTLVWVDTAAGGEPGANWACRSCLVGGSVQTLLARLLGVQVGEAEDRLMQQLRDEGHLAHPRYASKRELELAAERRLHNAELWNPDR